MSGYLDILKAVEQQARKKKQNESASYVIPALILRDRCGFGFMGIDNIDDCLRKARGVLKEQFHNITNEQIDEVWSRKQKEETNQLVVSGRTIAEREKVLKINNENQRKKEPLELIENIIKREEEREKEEAKTSA